ncbi:MAG: hypothetical protein F4233_03935 [Rhodospirillaceae bacterium]|nr:hypothetical protein [Rhodospirillaceae bacterium]
MKDVRVTDIDFNRIRSEGKGGQRAAFEEFLCQLARRDTSGEEGEFRRVEGSGGDGGVECYWLLKDGTKRAYQAKFWTRAGDISWKQVNASVEQALSAHPDMETYVVALPCDLTGRSGKKGKGKSGWQHWDTHLEKWQKLAQTQERRVDFQVWTASELQDKALRLLPAGAINYWFGSTQFDDEWFAAQSQVAISDLGIRYSPLAHIETEVQECFRAFVRDPASCRTVVRSMSCVRERYAALERSLETLGVSQLAAPLAALSNDFDQLRDEVFPTDIAEPGLWSEVKKEWRGLLERLGAVLSELRTPAKEQEPTGRAIREIDRLVEVCNQLERDFSAKPCQFWDAKAMLLVGPFGTGKSHAMGKILESAITECRPAVLFLGQKFANRSTRSQMIEFADLAPVSTWSEFLDSLNAASEAKGKLGLVLVDAINEGAGMSIWPNELAGILAEVAQRPALRVVVSCRTEFRDRMWPPEIDIAEYELQNFTPNEFERACVRLMDDQGISRPSVAFFPPELYNPLILSTACRSLKAQGQSHFPGSLAGLSDFVDQYLRGVAHSIRQQCNVQGSLDAPIRQAFLSLAEGLLKEGTDFLDETDARHRVHVAVGRTPPVGTEWLDAILGTGALRLDPNPQAQAWEPPGNVVRFAFQIHEQEFIARALVKQAGTSAKPFHADEPLEFVKADIERDGPGSIPYWSRDWPGVLMALSVLWPEARDGEEIVDVLSPRDECPTLHAVALSSTLEGFLWRKPERVTARTTELLRTLTDLPTVYATMFKFAGIASHPWNAFRLHKDLAAFGDMATRDSVWTVAINDSNELEATIQRQIDWMLGQRSSFVDTAVGKLVGIALTWTLTTTNRSLRDRATKALVHLFRTQPIAIPPLLDRFSGVDDHYILERLMAAVYGACCTLKPKDVRVAATAVYAQVFADGKPPAHLLIRDYALGVIERAEFLGVLAREIDIEKCTPPHATDWPLEMHTNAEIDELAASVGDLFQVIVRSCTTEYGRETGGYGDFGRYVLERRVRNFLTSARELDEPETNLQASRWDGELIGNWVAWAVYEFGWNADLFPNDATHGKYVGRSRGKIERIGKKYQWIAMYDLLGMLSDHVWCKDRYGDPKRYHSALDIEFCRDIDPTVVSDGCFENAVTYKSVALQYEGLGDVRHRDWPFVDESLLDLQQATTFVSEDGRRWYRLYARSSDNSWGKEGAASFLSETSVLTACVPISDLEVVLEGWEGRRKDPLFDLEPPDFTDHEYLYELDWREIRGAIRGGEEKKYLAADRRATEEPGFLTTVCRYVWESGEDETIPQGVTCHLPAPWVSKGTGLAIDMQHPTIFRCVDGSVGFFGCYETDRRGNTVCLIDADAFDHLLLERGLACLWVFSGERLLALGIGQGRRRSFGGVAWFDNGQFNSKTWWADRG